NDAAERDVLFDSRHRLHPRSCGLLHRTDDVVVAGATAEIPLERVPDLGLARVRRLAQQSDRRHDEAWRAVTALQPMLVFERLLHGMQRAVRREPFDRRDLLAVSLDAQDGARLHRLAVDEHRARAARRRVAADVRSRQPESFAQDVHEELTRLEVEIVLDPVDRHRDACHHVLLSPRGTRGEHTPLAVAVRQPLAAALDRAFHVPLGLALREVAALVPQLLPAGKRKLDLRATVAEVELRWDEGEPTLPHLARQRVDLLAPEEEL